MAVTIMSSFCLPRDSIQSNNDLESHGGHTQTHTHNFNLESEKLFPLRALMNKVVGKNIPPQCITYYTTKQSYGMWAHCMNASSPFRL